MILPRSYGELESLEWLETNGLGGYASSTVAGANSRRYHGLLVAALKPPVGRRVLLTKLDETLAVGGALHELADNRFPGVEPANAVAHLAAFERGLFPVMEFEAAGARLRKTVAAVHGENTTLVRYELLAGSAEAELILRPLMAPRGIHELAHANPDLRREARFEGGLLSVDPYAGGPTVHLYLPGGAFESDPAWYYRFQYIRERERGLDCEEDLFTHGRLRVPLAPGRPVDVVVSTADPRGRDLEALWRAETGRRVALGEPWKGAPGFAQRLALAADQFLARRGAAAETVIAGYPWFGDWGRDAMIALPGLCLATGRLGEARGILEAFLGSLDRGMLPNRFPESGTPPEYNTVDAALWLFVAVHRYLGAGGDRAFVLGTCLPALLESLDWHRRGTRYGIRVDLDGLLTAGEAGVQLTWMDAKVGDWVVTPRRGKAVEVNALWYNALTIAGVLARKAGRAAQAKSLGEEAVRLRAAFEAAFWNEGAGACFDVLGPDGPDPSLRPNQIFCLSLPFPLVQGERARRMLDAVEARLATPRGLRSLAPGDPRYVGRYEGDVARRDGAYHQGTVWAWLMGPYLEALVSVRGEQGRRQARALWEGFQPHLDEAGLGTVSEIFDGDAPHAPRGCIAQAWSVAELLRVVPLFKV